MGEKSGLTSLERCGKRFVVFVTTCSLVPAVAFSVSAQDFVTVTAKVRDVQISGEQKHPDFETHRTCDGVGSVAPVLKTTDDVSDFPGDNRGPEFLSGTCISSAESFSDWYNDKTSDVNRSYTIELPFAVDTAGLLTFGSRSFFPLDDPAGLTCTDNPPMDPFGKESERNNFGFTTEFHLAFTYEEGAGQVFKVTGDDDVWVFVNDSLVIDLGGVHPPQSGEILLDELPEGFLTDGEDYFIDFFHAERHTTKSTLLLKTNCSLASYESAIIPGRRAGRSGNRRAVPFRFVNDGNGFAIHSSSAGRISFYLTNGSLLETVDVSANKTALLPAMPHASSVVYRWENSRGETSGMLTTMR